MGVVNKVMNAGAMTALLAADAALKANKGSTLPTALGLLKGLSPSGAETSSFRQAFSNASRLSRWLGNRPDFDTDRFSNAAAPQKASGAGAPDASREFRLGESSEDPAGAPNSGSDLMHEAVQEKIMDAFAGGPGLSENARRHLENVPEDVREELANNVGQQVRAINEERGRASDPKQDVRPASSPLSQRDFDLQTARMEARSQNQAKIAEIIKRANNRVNQRSQDGM